MNIFSSRYFYYMGSALILLALAVYFGGNVFMEWWWFSTLKLGYYFVQRELYRDVITILVVSICTGVAFANLHFISWAMRDFVQAWHPKKNLWLLSVLLSLPIVIPVYRHWEDFLLYFFRASSPLQDPVYGKDVAYYLFALPVYRLIQNDLLVFFLLLTLVCVVFYWRLYHRAEKQPDRLPAAAKIHLMLLIVSIAGVIAWAISLQSVELLYEDRHEPVFWGPGFVDMKYRLPLIWMMFAALLSLTAGLIYTIHTHKGKTWLVVSGFALVVFSGLLQIDAIPAFIDKYYVQANPVVAEKKYIQYHIDATRDAFDIRNIEKIKYPLQSSLSRDTSAEIYAELYNIPLWDHQLLQNVFEQLQTIRPYYAFTPVTVDRYTLKGKARQVNIAVRELHQGKLPVAAQNWENQHMRYTHGYGAVAVPSAQPGGQPMQWLLSEISQQTDFDEFRLNRPEVYYGLANYPYAIVPNQAPRPQAKSGDINSDYRGQGGLSISSLALKALFAGFLKDEKLLFSSSITSTSKLLVRRNIVQRIRAIAPFLRLDADPYPVIADGKIFWIVDAYTTSDRYPLVKSVSIPGRGDMGEPFNYIRNAIKIVVDAYNGSVDFYICDNDDVIAATYRNIYPTLFKPLAEMPEALIAHLSYPQDLFAIQMQIYSRFHQTDPEVFYQQSEALELSRMEDKTIQPYYLTLDILDKPGKDESEREKFILVSPLSPIGRDNLHSVAVAGCLNIETCDTDYSADIYVYQFPGSIQVDGPGQISALINQNPEISRQFTLWNQSGSKVIKGRMFIIPVEQTLLYIQPVYLASTAKTGFPQLARVIVVMNQQSAMEDSIELAYKQLEKQLIEVEQEKSYPAPINENNETDRI